LVYEKDITSDTKARVAIEAVRGMKTISEIAAYYEAHSNHVSIWKNQFLDSASETFSHPTTNKE
jgi:putative transposase